MLLTYSLCHGVRLCPTDCVPPGGIPTVLLVLFRWWSSKRSCRDRVRSWCRAPRPAMLYRKPSARSTHWPRIWRLRGWSTTTRSLWYLMNVTSQIELGVFDSWLGNMDDQEIVKTSICSKYMFLNHEEANFMIRCPLLSPCKEQSFCDSGTFLLAGLNNILSSF